MAHRTEWIVEDHLLCVYLHGLILGDEIVDITADLHDFMIESNCRCQTGNLIHVIIDASEGTVTPQVKEYVNLPLFPRTSNLGWILLTGTSGMMRMVMGITGMALKSQSIAVNTFNEAVNFLSQRDFAIESFASHQFAV